jgi:hypothetical protein
VGLRCGSDRPAGACVGGVDAGASECCAARGVLGAVVLGGSERVRVFRTGACRSGQKSTSGVPSALGNAVLSNAGCIGVVGPRDRSGGRRDPGPADECRPLGSSDTKRPLPICHLLPHESNELVTSSGESAVSNDPSRNAGVPDRIRRRRRCGSRPRWAARGRPRHRRSARARTSRRRRRRLRRPGARRPASAGGGAPGRPAPVRRDVG